MKPVKPKLQFLDLSHHLWPLNWDELHKNKDLIAIGWKASEGNYNIDSTYNQARYEATRRGYLWLAYHFATNDPVSEQVDHFLNAAKPDNNTRLALDWEDYNSKQMKLDQVIEFLKEVDARTGRITTLYSGNTAKEALGSTKSMFLGHHPLWIPRYSGSLHDQPVPQLSWASWDIWQYAADGHGVTPNTAYGLPDQHPDCNTFSHEIAQVRATWSGRVNVELPQPIVVSSKVAHSDPEIKLSFMARLARIFT